MSKKTTTTKTTKQPRAPKQLKSPTLTKRTKRAGKVDRPEWEIQTEAAALAAMEAAPVPAILDAVKDSAPGDVEQPPVATVVTKPAKRGRGKKHATAVPAAPAAPAPVTAFTVGSKVRYHSLPDSSGEILDGPNARGLWRVKWQGGIRWCSSQKLVIA